MTRVSHSVEQTHCPGCSRPVQWTRIGGVRHWHCPSCADPLSELSHAELLDRARCAVAMLRYINRYYPHAVTEGRCAAGREFDLETVQRVM